MESINTNPQTIIKRFIIYNNKYLPKKIHKFTEQETQPDNNN